MGHGPLAMIAVRTAAVYVLMLVMIRLLGKRTIGNLTAFDMLIALIMGDLAGSAIYGEISLAGAAVAIVSLSALHYANSWLAYRRPWFATVAEGAPTVIVREGTFVHAGLRRERMSEREALAELRLAGINELKDVQLAQVECDGQISVRRADWAEPARREDFQDQRGRRHG